MKKILLSLSALVGFGMLTLQANVPSKTQSFADTAKDFLARARDARAKKAESGEKTAAKATLRRVNTTKAPRATAPGATDSIRSALKKHSTVRSAKAVKEKTTQTSGRRKARKTAPTKTKTA
jgi:hypothetical protein